MFAEFVVAFGSVVEDAYGVVVFRGEGGRVVVDCRFIFAHDSVEATAIVQD